MAEKDRIIIVSGGPIGYTAALNLAHFGIPFVLLEEADGILEDPRTGRVHPPTLEMFDKLGVTGTMLDHGYVVRNYHYLDRRQGLIAEFHLGVLAGDTPYPFRLMLEQHKISHILHDKLATHSGRQFLNGDRVTDVRKNGGTAMVTAMAGGGAWTFEGRFLVITTPFEFAKHGYAHTNYIADPEMQRAYLRLAAMIEGVKRAALVT